MGTKTCQNKADKVEILFQQPAFSRVFLFL